MPLYEYHCGDCGTEFEKMVRFSEAEQSPSCPSCQGRNTRKKISVFASFGSSTGNYSSSSSNDCSSNGGFT